MEHLLVFQLTCFVIIEWFVISWAKVITETNNAKKNLAQNLKSKYRIKF